jgi:hypothetical protein
MKRRKIRVASGVRAMRNRAKMILEHPTALQEVSHGGGPDVP